MSTATATAPERTNGAAPQATEVARPQPQRIVVQDNSAFANLLDTAKYEHLWRVAQSFAASDLVPDQFKGKPANCYVAIQMAIRLGVDPFMFLQSCYIVHGRPGLEAKLAIALANKSGVFIGPIRYKLEGTGKDRKCTAYATLRETEEVIEMAVDWAMVEAEGWSSKAGSKWRTMPEVMFRYRSAMMLIRTHCPEVIMGMHSADELEDAGPRTITVDSQPVQSLDNLADRLLGESPAPRTDRPQDACEIPADHRQQASRVSDEPAPDSNPDTGAKSPWEDAVQADLARTTSVKESADTVARWKPNVPEGEHFKLDAMHSENCERIKASRGPRSNERQGTMA